MEDVQAGSISWTDLYFSVCDHAGEKVIVFDLWEEFGEASSQDVALQLLSGGGNKEETDCEERLAQKYINRTELLLGFLSRLFHRCMEQ